MRKIIFAIFTAAAVLTPFTAEAFAENAGFAVESERALPAKTPFDKSRVDILWSTDKTESAGVPSTFGEYVLLPVINTVQKLSEKDGSLVGTVSFGEKVSEDHRGAVLNGVLVQPARTSLYVVELTDMSVRCAKTFGDIVTDIAAWDNLAYFGVKTEDAYKFICADMDKELEIVWEYSSEKAVTSPALFGDFAVFGAGENLVVHRLNAADCSENPVGAEITNVFAGKYAVFMTGGDGNLYKLRLTDDGKAEADTLTSCAVGGTLTAPAEFNNRVYLGSTEGFFVLDGLNMEVLKAYPEMKNASAPIVCYGNGQRAYTVVPDMADNTKDVLYGIFDTEDGQTASEIVKIIDFTNGKIAVSQSGTMYFRDAAGRLWAIAAAENDILLIAVKLVLTLAIIVMLLLIIRAWAKKRGEKRPPQY